LCFKASPVSEDEVARIAPFRNAERQNSASARRSP